MERFECIAPIWYLKPGAKVYISHNKIDMNPFTDIEPGEQPRMVDCWHVFINESAAGWCFNMFSIEEVETHFKRI